MDYATQSGLWLGLAVAVLLVLERAVPWRRPAAQVRHRWLTNLGLMLTGSLCIGFFFSADLGTIATEMPNGALRDTLLPLWLETLFVVLLLDAWRYFEHRVFHEVPLLWRAHLVHHSDTALDITTSQRHHPIESVLVTATGMLLLFAVGFSAASLAFYVLVASLFALWTHANTRLPEGLDRILRRVIVTPAVHAVHHSDLAEETNSNYGTLLTVWDQLFGTYVDPTTARIPHYGLEYFHREQDTTLGPVLLQPFEYRTDHTFYPAREHSGKKATIGSRSAEATPAVSALWQRASWQVGLCLLVCALVLWPTVASMITVWQSADTYQYAWLVIPAMLYLLLAQHRNFTLAQLPCADYRGLLLIVPAAALWSAGHLADIQVAQHFAFVVITLGILLCVLGRATWTALLPALAMLFMLVPAGDLLQAPLRRLTVIWIEWFAVAFSLPLVIEGFVAYVGDHRYVVIDACSGLTYVLMGGFLGYTLGLVPSLSFSRALVLGMTGALLGIATNALRVWMILAVDAINGTQLDMAGHTDLQWIALLACMGLLLFLVVRASGSSAQQPRHPVISVVARPLAPALAGLTVLATVGSVQAMALLSEPSNDSALAALAALYPRAREGEALAGGRDQSLIVPLDNRVDAILVVPEGSSSRIHERRFYPHDLTIWRHARSTTLRDCTAHNCVEFVHEVFRRKGSDDERHAVFAYFAGNTLTASSLRYRITNSRNHLLGDATQSGALGFAINGVPPGDGTLAFAFLQLHAQLQGRPLLAVR